MDRLELGVDQGGVHQRGQPLVIEEPLPCVQTVHEFRGRRRNVGRVVQRASGWPDPVLAAPELAWRRRIAPDAAHETLVHLAHQAQGHGQRLHAFEAVFQGGHVVGYLTQVVGASLHDRARLGGEQLPQGRLGPLDAAGQDGLLPNEGPYQEVGIGQAPSFAGKPADGPIGGREAQGDPVIPRQGRRERGRHIGPIVPRTVHRATMRPAFSFSGCCHAAPY